MNNNSDNTNSDSDNTNSDNNNNTNSDNTITTTNIIKDKDDDNIIVDGLHWTPKKEKILQNWCFEAELYVWLHNYNADYYNRLDKCISIPAIIISAITSTALFSSIGMDDNKVVIIIFAILLVIGVFLQSIRDFLNVHQLSIQNRHTAKIYQIISNDIEEQLNQEVEERENGRKFIQKIKSKINDIIMNSPPITDKSWKRLQININQGNIIRFNKSQFFRSYFKKPLLDNKSVKIHVSELDNNGNIQNQLQLDENTITENKNKNIDIDELDISINNLKNKLRFLN